MGSQFAILGFGSSSSWCVPSKKQPPKVGYTGLSYEEALTVLKPADQKYKKVLEQLMEMSFLDITRNLELCKKFNSNVEQITDSLFENPGKNPLPHRAEAKGNSNIFDYSDDTMNDIKQQISGFSANFGGTNIL